MLAAIRRFAKSWVAAVLIGLLVVSFAIFGVNDALKGNYTNDVVRAGSRKISPTDFRRDFDNYRKNAEQQMGQPVSVEMAVENGLDRRILQEIATREAFGELMNRSGVRPSDNLFAQELGKIQAFFNPITRQFDKATYLRRLSEANLTPEGFERAVRDEIAQTHTASAMVNGLRVPRAYGALAAVFEGEARDIGYFSVDPRGVTPPAPPTDAQLTQFMKENEARLTRPETRVLTIVTFSPALAGANLPVDEAEVKKRFDYRRDTLSRPETRSLVQIAAKDAAAAQAIAARLNKGEDPAAVAKAMGANAIPYVDKPKTAIADRRVAEAAFALKEGQVSGPIQGELGLAVVKVGKVTPAQAVTLEQVRPQIEAELRKDAAAEKVYALSQAYEDAHAEGASLAEAAQKAGVPAVTIGPVRKDGRGPQGQPLPGVSPKVLEVAFGLEAGTESEIQETGDGEYFAVRVDRVVPKSLPPLAEVRPQLTQVWMMREMVKRLQARADQFAERVKKGESLETVAAAAGAKVARVDNLDRRSAGQVTALSRDALTKAFGAKPGDVFTAEDVRFGLIVAKLEAVRAPTGATEARIAEDIRPQLSMAMFREIGEATRRAAVAEIKPKTYPDKARAALGLEPLKTSDKAEKKK